MAGAANGGILPAGQTGDEASWLARLPEWAQRSDTPIYAQLAHETGVHIPDPLDTDPVHALLTPSAGRPVDIDPDEMPPEGAHRHGVVP